MARVHGVRRPHCSAAAGLSRRSSLPTMSPPTSASAPRQSGGDGGALAGEWYTGRVSTIQYRNETTGVMAPTSGNNMTYRIKTDGTYEQFGLMQFNYGACTNSYFMNITGRYEVRGDSIRFTPLDGTYDSRTCGGQPVRKPANKVVSEYRVRRNGDELVMTDSEGRSSTYRRK